MSIGTLSISNTITDMMNKINEIISVGVGNNAVYLNGQPATYYVANNDYTASVILTKIKTVDGANSGLDADLLDGNDSSYFLPAATYTASDVLTKIKTVDGANSGLDADLLDGNDSSYFLPAATYTAADILTKIKTVDGANSGLDADLLDGHDTSYFLASSAYTASDVLTKIKTVDGANSGLDADKLDGYDATAFAFMYNDVAFNSAMVRTAVKAGSYYTSSDETLKFDIHTVSSDQFNKVTNINVVNYRLKSDEETKRVGVIAQELQSLYPEFVHEVEDGEHKHLTVDYNSIIMCMLAKVQEQEKRIKKLEKEVFN